jgi:2-polyprenyl-6-methoxyphenol hydroxylase-like FAD-dependent oxidoreductase
VNQVDAESGSLPTSTSSGEPRSAFGVSTRCVIVGGGPAGMMTGYLLARAGVDVIVLEKHADFNRDFRGDTIHPSTLEVMGELGLLDDFLKVPHQQYIEMEAMINGHVVPMADFSHLPTRCKFIAFMPQWDFLNFLSDRAKRFPSFTLHMQHEVIDLIMENDRVIGVRAKTPKGEREFRACLVIGADGRHAITHTRANLELREVGVPIDVLWMLISKRPGDPEQRFGFFRNGRFLVLIDRGQYFQAGLVIPKGGYEDLKRQGLPAVHQKIIALAPFLQDRIAELDDWSKIKLLTVQINRLKQWAREGLLCIGDSAHAMSPAGGVGINLALQDAVATANLLTDKLKAGPVSLSDLMLIQKRRQFPTWIVQTMQTFVHRRIVTGQSKSENNSLPILGRVLRRSSIARRAVARLIGLGPRPEHIHSPTNTSTS